MNDLKAIGLGATFTPISFNELVRRGGSPPYDWEAIIGGGGGSGPEPNGSSNLWRSSGLRHMWWPKEPKPETPWEAEIDDLWRRGAQEMDPAQRVQIYNRWQEIVGEEQPLIIALVPDQLYAIRNRFGNVKPCSLGGVDWNLEEIFDQAATRSAP